MSGIRRRYGLTILLLIIDALAVAAALLIGSRIVTRVGVWHDPLTQRWLSSHEWALGLAVPLWLVVFALTHLYRRRCLFLGAQEYSKVVTGCTSGVMSLAMASILLPGPTNVSAAWLLITWAVAVVLVGSGRFGFRRLLRRLQRRGRFVSRAILLGVNEQAKSIMRSFESSQSGVTIVGFVDDDIPAGTIVEGHVRVLGSPRSTMRLVREFNVDQLIIVHEALAWESFRDILEESSFDHDGLEIKILPNFHEILTTGVDIQHTGFMPLLALDRVRITGFDAFLKNALDYGMSLIILMVTGPFMAATALILPLLGSGPILQRDSAHGRKGSAFARYSFNLRHRSGIQSGWRGIVVRLILRCRLEMWPQIFNVLFGQMSLVGPRTVHLGQEHRVTQWLPNLVTVKPGITGPWAIAAAARGPLVSEMRGTMYYVRSYSIWLDLQILFHTVKNLVRYHPSQLRLRYLERISPSDLRVIQGMARRLTTEVPAGLCCVAVWDEERHALAVAALVDRNDSANETVVDDSADIGLADAPLLRAVMEAGQTLSFGRLPQDLTISWPQVLLQRLDAVESGALLPLAGSPATAGVVLLARRAGNDGPNFDEATLRRCRALISASMSNAPSEALRIADVGLRPAPPAVPLP